MDATELDALRKQLTSYNREVSSQALMKAESLPIEALYQLLNPLIVKSHALLETIGCNTTLLLMYALMYLGFNYSPWFIFGTGIVGLIGLCFCLQLVTKDSLSSHVWLQLYEAFSNKMEEVSLAEEAIPLLIWQLRKGVDEALSYHRSPSDQLLPSANEILQRRNLYQETLIKVLPNITPEVSQRLSNHDRTWLIQQLDEPYSHVDLTISVMVAIPKIRDLALNQVVSEKITTLSIEGNATANMARITTVAQQTRKVLRTQKAKRKESNLLLRASNQPPETGSTLLRPAKDSPEDSQDLLRPTSSER